MMTVPLALSSFPPLAHAISPALANSSDASAPSHLDVCLCHIAMMFAHLLPRGLSAILALRLMVEWLLLLLGRSGAL